MAGVKGSGIQGDKMRAKQPRNPTGVRGTRKAGERRAPKSVKRNTTKTGYRKH